MLLVRQSWLLFLNTLCPSFALASSLVPGRGQQCLLIMLCITAFAWESLGSIKAPAWY